MFSGVPSDRFSGSKVCPVSIILHTTLRIRPATLLKSTDKLAHYAVAFEPRFELFTFRTAMHPGHGVIHFRSDDGWFMNRRTHHNQTSLIFFESLKHDPDIAPERVLELTRNHWKIKNCLHWVLDVVMDEDRMRNRIPSGSECLGALRRIALNIVHLMDDEHSFKERMEITAMSDEYLIGLLVNAVGKF